MTRPMPGPHGLPEGWFALDYGPIYNSLGQEVPTKRLTGAECAAEYWRAEADHTAVRNGEGVGWSSAEVEAALEHEVEVWQRFATRPHAFKETP